jgi:hypothetical protein
MKKKWEELNLKERREILQKIKVPTNKVWELQDISDLEAIEKEFKDNIKEELKQNGN